MNASALRRILGARVFRLILIPVFITGLLAASLKAVIDNQVKYRELELNYLHFQQVLGRISYLSEGLTASAHMNASNSYGKPYKKQWAERYADLASQMNTALVSALGLAGDTETVNGVRELVRINKQLVETENQSMELVRQGDFSKAEELLASEIYLGLKDEFIEKLTFLSNSNKTRSEAEMSKKQNGLTNILYFYFTLAIALMALIVGLQKLQFGLIDRLSHAQSQLIREKEVAIHANEAKSRFLANMSHELRTPLHGILSYARFGQKKADSADKQKLKNYFDEIHDSAGRLMAVLNDLLDLSKLESRSVSLNLEQAPLIVVLDPVISEMSAFAQEKNLKLVLEREESQINAEMDTMRMAQVFRNLISNAIKFSYENSSIVIRVHEKTEELICQVINEGPGIPASELESIFDKFVQSSRTRSGAGGTGLGLAICKEIIRQHRGEIWAESGESGLTTFSVRIPKCQIETVALAA